MLLAGFAAGLALNLALLAQVYMLQYMPICMCTHICRPCAQFGSPGAGALPLDVHICAFMSVICMFVYMCAVCSVHVFVVMHAICMYAMLTYACARVQVFYYGVVSEGGTVLGILGADFRDPHRNEY